MKIYQYQLPTTNSFYSSFDFGEVWASSLEEAKEKAIAQLNYDISKANELLASSDNTFGFEITICTDALEIEETDITLVDVVLEQIKQEIKSGDTTAIVELLEIIPNKNLIGYLPEDKSKSWRLK